MFWPAVLFTAQMWLGEVTRKRPKKVSFQEFIENNKPSEVRPLIYAGGTIELTPSRIWFGDFKQRAVERDSHWTDYIWAGGLAFLLDTITVGYRYYVGEVFALCFGPDRHVQRVTIEDRLMYQAALDFDNAGGGFLIDDPQAWGGDQPPGEGGQYSFCVVTRGNYTDAANAYLESLLATPPNKCPSLRGVTALISQGPSGDVPESGYFAAGGVGYTPRLKEWKVVVRGQPDNLATGFNKIGRHMNPMEVIYEWMTSLEYGARVPLDEINLANLQANAQTLFNENNGWSGQIQLPTSPLEVVQNVLDQIDAVPDNSPSLGLGFRLIRRNYSLGSLRTLDQSVITRVNEFTPGTYEDTVNQINVEYPEDQGNDFAPRKAPYIGTANQQIQGGRIVPQTVNYLGVADSEQAQVIATRLGRAQELPRAPLDCFVHAPWGRLTYIGEVVVFEWRSPSFSIVMRVQKITPNGPEESDYHLVLIEDQFSTGLRTFGEPGEGAHTDPGEGLLIAPPSATWDSVDFPPEGLEFTLQTTNTNQFLATITGHIVFGVYAPGGQYARVYVTEPGGVQTLSPLRLSPDTNNEAEFTWPALTAGVYEFCVQTFSLKDATNGVKVCADITVAQLGSPSPSPSASVSPSSSQSLSPSASASISPSASASPSSSVSPSPSISPSSSASPSAPPPSTSEIIITGNAEVERDGGDLFTFSGGFASGVTGAHGRVYDNVTFTMGFTYPGGQEEFVSAGCRVFVRTDATATFMTFRVVSGSTDHIGIRRLIGGNFSIRNFASGVNTDSGAANFTEDTWFYVMLYARIHQTLGECTAKLFDASGALVETLTQTTTDTQNGANLAEISTWGNPTNDTYVDSLWTDLTGTFRGAGYVETRSPTADGDTVSWTRGGTDTGNNWDQVNELPKDQTSYVFSTAADQVELYNFEDKAQAGSLVAVHQIIYAHAHTAGTREYRPICKIGGVVYEEAIQSTTDTSNLALPVVIRWHNSPATGGAWTEAEYNSAQFGVKSVTTDVRVQNVQIHLLIDIAS